jgi:transposase
MEGSNLAKYSEQVKLAAVKAYCSGKGGLKATAARYDVEVSSLRKWIAGYQANGVDGIRLKRRELYSVDFKLEVLQRAREERLSHRQAAALFNIRNFNMIGVWERRHERDGLAGLIPYLSSGNDRMTSEPPPTSTSNPGVDGARTQQELLEELKSLRAENAYLKKFYALVQAQRTSAQEKERNS